jgi:hypothetical protein
MNRNMVNYHSWNAIDREKGNCTEKINLKCIAKINFLPPENSVVSIINETGYSCLQEVTCIYSENLIRIINIAPIIQTGGNTLYISVFVSFYKRGAYYPL